MPSKAALREAAALKKDDPPPLSNVDRMPLLMKASAKVKEEEENSTLFDKKYISMVSRFEEKELIHGKKLGQGGFCSVFEVSKINLSSERATAEEENLGTLIKAHHTRKNMSEECLRNTDGIKGARYAIKRLSDKSLANSDLYEKGTADLATEAHFLSVIQHTNIIKVRGYALGDFCADGFFLVMDRLYDTLETAKRKWSEMIKKNSSILKLMRGGKDKIAELFTERIEYAYDLANALNYLHSMKIIYRDLKPENIGFDIRGDIKIFDFGLSKEVRNPDSTGNYELTGYCGSPIYMAPEVIKCIPYNLSSDIFSFAIVLWEMMSLNVPYRKLSKNLVEKMVTQKNYRPSCDQNWPAALIGLIEKAWASDPQKRPGFKEIMSTLGKLQMELGGDDGNLDKSLDRSTRSFMMRKGDAP